MSPAANPYYPRSFTMLVILAMGVLILPLASGLIGTVHRLEGVIDTQREFIGNSLTITRDIREVIDDVNQLQRTAGQYHLLQDKELAGSLRGSYRDLHQRLTELSALLTAPAPQATLQAVGEINDRLYLKLRPGRFLDSETFNALKPEFAALHSTARILQTSGDNFVQIQLHVLEDEMRAARRRLQLLALALIPLTLVLAAIFSGMINRPIRQLKAAIQQLRRGDLRALPKLTGPQDIVELRNEIDWLRQQLGEIDAQKIQFLRHVSHELKTPLASLREGVGLLAERVAGPMTERQRSIVEIMDHSSRELQHRIEDLIRYSGMMREVGMSTITQLNLSEVLNTVLLRHRLAIEAHHLQMDVQLSAPTVYADREQMETMLDNLLSNAVKFSPVNGCVLIRSYLITDIYHLQICDQGPGIPAAERTRIFDAFVQGAHQPVSAVKGSGLGLSIVREILRTMGGRIEVGDLPPWSVCMKLQWPAHPVRDAEHDAI